MFICIGLCIIIVMFDLNDLVMDALEASDVSDEREQELKDEATEFVDKKDNFASEAVTYDGYESEIATSTVVWNSNIVYMDAEAGTLGTSVELISQRSEDRHFIGMDMSSMTQLFGQSQDQEMTYLYGDQDDLSEYFEYNMPLETRSPSFYINNIQNAEVTETDETVFFHRTVEHSDFEWFNSKTFKADTNTESIQIVLTYDKSDEQLESQLLTVQNSDDMNTHVLSQYLYDEKFEFTVPDVGDKNVIEMDEMGGNMLGGGMMDGVMDDLVGGSGVDDLVGDDNLL